MKVAEKTKIELPCDPVLLLLDIGLKGCQYTRELYTCVYYGTTQNSQDTESAQVLIQQMTE